MPMVNTDSPYQLTTSPLANKPYNHFGKEKIR